MHYYIKQALRFVGYMVLSVVTGLAVYQSPPESWAQFGEWAWQPFLQGLLMGLTGLGLNKLTP